jgi:nitrate reductase beta subunit
MKIRAQIAMVLNLDKCIGCHTCSVTCKNLWTSREGVEYAWFNNVETKPGIGYPKEWESQKKWKGGWERGRDGIVLIDHDKCRGWRMCVSACPYKKIYNNWKSGKSEKCILCYPRLEAGQPTVCSERCVGRIRYLGVMLYDADRIAEAAAAPAETHLYRAQLDIFLDPHDSAVRARAARDGVPEG